MGKSTVGLKRDRTLNLFRLKATVFSSRTNGIDMEFKMGMVYQSLA